MKYNLLDECYKEFIKEATFIQKMQLYFWKYFYKIQIELETLLYNQKGITK